jgi:hypothetical protein
MRKIGDNNGYVRNLVGNYECMEKDRLSSSGLCGFGTKPKIKRELGFTCPW